MIHGLLADGVMAVHFAFILFLIFGGFLALRRSGWAFFHLPAVIWAVLLEFNGWICPLTPLENHFRRMAGQGGYDGGFIETYLAPVIYPEGLTRNLQIYIGAAVLVWNLIIYWRCWVLHRRSRQGRPLA
jgi:hypothetical protein